MIWISILKTKGEVCKAFKELHQLVKTEYRRDIHTLQSDNGGEYVNLEMKEFCKQNSIRHQTSCARTPQQNGLAERRNRMILEIVRASLFDMTVPRKYWGEAVRSAAHIINQTPSKVIDFRTPLQKLHELIETPPRQDLEPRIFGCTTYVHQNVGKLEPRATRCVFIGYVDFKKGYRCLDPTNGKIYVTRDVAFHETVPYFNESTLQGKTLCEVNLNEQGVFSDFSDCPEDRSHGVGEPHQGSAEPDQNREDEASTPETETTTDANTKNNTSTSVLQDEHEDTHTEQEREHEDIPTEQELDHDDEIEETTGRDEEVELEDSGDRRYPIRSNRGKPKKQYQPELKAKGRYSISNYVSPHRLARSHALIVEELTTTTIPSDVQEALNDERWKNAMNEEMEALQKNQTWELVKLPNGKVGGFTP